MSPTVYSVSAAPSCTTGFTKRACSEGRATVWIHGADVEVAKTGSTGKERPHQCGGDAPGGIRRPGNVDPTFCGNGTLPLKLRRVPPATPL